MKGKTMTDKTIKISEELYKRIKSFTKRDQRTIKATMERAFDLLVGKKEKK